MRAVTTVLAAATVVLAACSSPDPARSPTVAPPAPSGSASPTSGSHPPAVTSGSRARPLPAPAPSGVTVTVEKSQYGPVLVDQSGQAIYVFDLETTSTPACYSDCARAWPPVLTIGPPVAARTVQPNLLGTTTRADGKHQVAYRGRPLYFYAREGKHQVLCHNVSEFGGRWLAITATGAPAPS